MNAVAKLPTTPTGGAPFALQRAATTANMLLHAIQAGVFVIAPDIPRVQRREIIRELGIAKWNLDSVFNETGIHRLPGSFHLLRDGDTWEGEA